eukprot:5534946-Amphidinium_carterae.3
MVSVRSDCEDFNCVHGVCGCYCPWGDLPGVRILVHYGPREMLEPLACPGPGVVCGMPECPRPGSC